MNNNSSPVIINGGNVDRKRQELNLKAAIIARPDWFMEEHHAVPLVIETPYGTHLRCYAASHHGINFLIVYGRFEKVRTTSTGINFEITQEAISMLRIRSVVGNFVTGSIQEKTMAGEIYIPHDFVGLGGYNQTRNRDKGFRNVDMFHPFCPHLRSDLIAGAAETEHSVHGEGVYACFHGYPRIETHAELQFYQKQGWDVVGQTLDPEATLAREAGCHYAAMAATIDDEHVRRKFMNNDPTARETIDGHIVEGRRKMFEVFLNALPLMAGKVSWSCNCVQQEEHVGHASKRFYYRPNYLIED